MEFGQILDPIELSHVKMTLPALNSPEELKQLERLQRAAARNKAAPKVRIGTPIFSHSPWVGNFYPETATATDFLREYSKQLSTVELNSTFYAIPSAEIFQKWNDSVDEQFRFCPKFPKSISHSLDPNHADLKVFTERVLTLGEKLGVCFLQLPHYFSVQEKDRLNSLLIALSRELKTVVEFRNPEFFTEQRLKEEWVETLAQNYIGAVSVDTPGVRAVSHVSLTSTRMMVRFVGANLHESDRERLIEWAERVAVWYQSGLKEIYFIVHEPDNSLAPQAAEIFIEALNQSLTKRMLDYSYPKIAWHHLF